MIISHRHKFIFIENPYCGGEFVRLALAGQLAEYDFDSGNLKKTIQDDPDWFYLNQYLLQSFDKNPYAMAQEIQCVMQLGLHHPWEDYYKFGFMRHPITRAAMFTKDYFSVERGFNSQQDWFYYGKKKLVNFIGKYENLKADFEKVISELKLKPIVTVYKPDDKDVTKYSDLIPIEIKDFLKQDCKRLGYA